MKILPAILDACHRLLHDPEFLRRARTSPNAFTRSRKLSFADYMLFLISGAKNSLQAELNHYLDMTNREDQTYSKQAFSKGRQRIRPEAFKELSDVVVRSVFMQSVTRTWENHHLLAIDGSRLNLPINPALSQEFGEQITGGAAQPQALCSCLFDVLNGIIVDARLDGCRGNERKHAEEMIRALDAGLVTNPLFLMDRGYPSYEMIALFEQLGYKYLMRCDTTFLRSIYWDGVDTVVTHKFSKAKEPIQFRLVTVALPSGEAEYLITNVYDSELTVEKFSDLYHQRWGIEVRYNDLKGKLQIENFTGNTPVAVRQDFFATLYLANLAGVMAIDYRDEIEAIHNTPENARFYRMNVNLTISQLKQNAVAMLLCNSALERSIRLTFIARRLKSAVVPSRPGRSSPRKKQHERSVFPQNRKLP